jgi:hypothetical protein
MSSTDQASNPTAASSPTDTPGQVESFLSHNAAALIIVFPFAILLLAALAKCCLIISSRGDDVIAATNPNEKHTADWVSELQFDDAELGCREPVRPAVGSAADAAMVDERVAAGYDGAYRGH